MYSHKCTHIRKRKRIVSQPKEKLCIKGKTNSLVNHYFLKWRNLLKKYVLQGWKTEKASREYGIAIRSLNRYIKKSMDENSSFYPRAQLSGNQDAPTPKRLKRMNFTMDWNNKLKRLKRISNNNLKRLKRIKLAMDCNHNLRTRATAPKIMEKIPTMTEATSFVMTEVTTGNEMETDPESRLEIKECHIQQFLKDIADIDFGF